MKINILVVDDRPEGILAVQAVLDSPEYNLVVASSGTEALRGLLKDDFAVILLDVQMPIMNGYETAEIIKTREKSRHTPIIFMSAINKDEMYVYQGYEAGAVDYLLKPFDPYILRSKVAIFVDIYKKNLVIQDQAKKLYEAEIKNYSMAFDRLELDSLKRYRYLADAIPQIIFRLLPNGHFDYFNKMWLEYTGLSAEKSNGLGWLSVVHPDDIKKLTSLLDAEQGQDCECRVLSKEGYFRWHLFRVQPESYAINSGEKSWLGTATDIEDRKRHEDGQKFLAEAGTLLASSLDYGETLQSIAKLVVPHLADWCSIDIVEDEGIKSVVTLHRDPKRLALVKELHANYLCNPRSEFGISKVISTGKSEVYPEITDKIIEKYGIDERHMMIARELRDKSAMIVPLSVKGRVFGAITFVSDRFGRHYDDLFLSVAEELGRRASLAYENSWLYKLSQEAIQLRTDFLSIASHELNTPITSLKLQLQLTRKNIANNITEKLSVERLGNSLDSSLKQVDRLITLIQVLLDVSKIQSGKLFFSFQSIKFSQLIKEVVERHQEILISANCQLEVDCPENLEINCDKLRIEQVLINLITNGVKYAPGKMELKVKEEQDSVRITFKDYGEGIPEKKVKNIFDRFERATTNESLAGLGLGLYIVKQIIEGHRGKIDVFTEATKGTTFIIHLPKDGHQMSLEMPQIH